MAKPVKLTKNLGWLSKRDDVILKVVKVDASKNNVIKVLFKTADGMKHNENYRLDNEFGLMNFSLLAKCVNHDFELEEIDPDSILDGYVMVDAKQNKDSIYINLRNYREAPEDTDFDVEPEPEPTKKKRRAAKPALLEEEIEEEDEEEEDEDELFD